MVSRPWQGAVNNRWDGRRQRSYPNDVAMPWGEFFLCIADSEMTALRRSEISPSDCETEPIPEPNTYGYSRIVQSKELRDDCPGRRMFDYKCVDSKYGTLYETDLNEEKFEEGDDHASWVQLVSILELGH